MGAGIPFNTNPGVGGLAELTSSEISLVQNLSGLGDPNADRILFWDDSAGLYQFLTVGSGLTIVGTTLSATGGGTIDGSGSANELVYWVDTDTIGSLSTATYPSLAELSYVKGVTSAIQTQIDGKIDGTMVATRIPIGSDANTLTTDADLTYDSTNNVLTVGGLTMGKYGGEKGFEVTTGQDIYFVTNGDYMRFQTANSSLDLLTAGGGTYTAFGINYGGYTGNINVGNGGAFMDIVPAATLSTRIGADGTTGYLQINTSGLIQFHGTTSSFPALKRSSAILQARLADDSAYTDIEVADDAYGAGWNGSLEVPTKNALYDEIETKGDIVDIQVFTSNGTWTKPTGAKIVEVILVGAGSGGGSGRKGAAGTARGGGGAGGSGGTAKFTFQASLLGSTETITIGAGGSGGASQTTNSTDGNDGAAGGDTTFGSHLIATGPTQGGGGGTEGGSFGSNAGAGLVYWSLVSGLTGYSGSDGVSAAEDMNEQSYIANAGGGGGGISTADTVLAAGNGGGGSFWFGVADTAKFAGGAKGGTGANGSNGTAATSNSGLGGGGGGGGGASTTGNAGNGGNGGIYGAGGGGGGASTDSVGNSGAGGNGANGIAIVITYF